MTHIHPTAIIEHGAELHPSVHVGPWSLVESGAVIGEGCVIESNARIFGATRMGRHNRVCHGAVLGCEPQDLGFTPEKSKPLVIGDHNHFKEYTNIHRGTKSEHGSRIGDHNYFMCGFHVGHDSIIGNHNVLGPNTAVAGHVILGDRVFLSGLVAVHQFTRIGDYAMIAGCAKIVKDIPPYSTADGNPARLVGVNSVGLRRNAFAPAVRNAIKQAYRVLYRSGLNTSQAIVRLRAEELLPEVAGLVAFFESSERGVTDHR